MFPLDDKAVIDTDTYEKELETTDCAPLPEPVTETETKPGDDGDRVTAETDIEKSVEPAVTMPEKISEAVTEPAPIVVSDNTPDPVIITIEPTIDTFPVDEIYSEQQGSTNAPVFVNPCRGGPNPFDDDIPSDIDDHSSDEFVGDGDRPGEGILY